MFFVSLLYFESGVEISAKTKISSTSLTQKNNITLIMLYQIFHLAFCFFYDLKLLKLLKQKNKGNSQYIKLLTPFQVLSNVKYKK